MSIESSNHTAPINLEDEPEVVFEKPATSPEVAATPKLPANPAAARIQEYATRANLTGKEGMDKKKLVLLAGGLLLAVAFFVLSQFQSKPVKKHPVADQKQQQNTTAKTPTGSATPMMDPVVPKNNDQEGDHINASDIARTKKPDYSRTSTAQTASASGGKSLNSVPPFKDTQQKWEEPAPYGTPQSPPQNTAVAQQEANALKEASLVYVRAPQQPSNSQAEGNLEENTPALRLKEGTRIEARLEMQISSDIHAPVVAVVENTYTIGDQVLVPAGARIYGRLSQADAQGNVGVDFNEIELLDGGREKVEAIGTSLDMGPIKGDVYGKHNGRNFFIRSMSGISSTAAMLVGNNVNGAYSESNMIRERAAENIGMAGDSQLMQLNSGTHLTVSVPANTKIYVVWTQHAKSAEKVTRASTTP